jgi:peptidoglycan/LPS O-acetylase OafA/YrhL
MATAFALDPIEVRPLRRVTPRFYHPELDCLRFLAFFGVFWFHTLPPESTYYANRHFPLPALWASLSRSGSFGVDLFFLLSAFLITELLLREKEQTGAVHLRWFYLRRILRIWPLYLLGVLIASLLPIIYRDQVFPLKYLIAFLLLSGNWIISFAGFPLSAMNPLWSVSFEEQFYLLWPLVVSKVKRRRSLVLVAAVLTMAAMAARLLLLRYGRHSDTTIFTNTIARLDPIAWGIATAVLFRNRPIVISPLARAAICGAGIAVWLMAGHAFALTRSFMLAGYPAMTLGAWLIFISVFGMTFAPRWLRYLGKISYGLYVWHLLALFLTLKLLGGFPHTARSFIVFWCLGLALTIVTSALSYRFLETPLLRLKERFALVKSRPV